MKMYMFTIKYSLVWYVSYFYLFFIFILAVSQCERKVGIGAEISAIDKEVGIPY